MTNDYLWFGIDLLIGRYVFFRLVFAAGGWYMFIRVVWVENVSQVIKNDKLEVGEIFE